MHWYFGCNHLPKEVSAVCGCKSGSCYFAKSSNKEHFGKEHYRAADYGNAAEQKTSIFVCFVCLTLEK